MKPSPFLSNPVTSTDLLLLQNLVQAPTIWFHPGVPGHGDVGHSAPCHPSTAPMLVPYLAQQQPAFLLSKPAGYICDFRKAVESVCALCVGNLLILN